MNDKIEKYLDQAEGIVLDAYQLVVEQAPLLVEEILAWQLIVNTGGAIILFLVCGLIMYIVLTRDEDYGDDGVPFLCFILACVTFTFGIIISLQAVKVKVAPRLVIMEEIVKWKGK